MYQNITKYGVARQKTLYKAEARKVISVYEASAEAGLSTSETLEKMTDAISKIVADDPSAFAHTAASSRLQAVDIDPASVKGDRNELIRSFKEDSEISKMFIPPKDPAIHVEIPQGK